MIPNATSVQIIRPGSTLIRGLAPSSIWLDQDVAEKAAEEAVEDDGLGEREPEPHQTLELATELGLAGDGLDHGAEDVADAGAGAGGAEADTEGERDRLAGADDRRLGG